jgi:ferritin-like metal-binding protein YciE
MPKVLEESDSEWLAGVLEEHLEETRVHVDLVTELFRAAGAEPVAAASASLEGHRKAHDQGVGSIASPRLRDVFLANAAARVEHLELELYAWLKLLAGRIGLDPNAVDRIRSDEEAALGALRQAAARLVEETS